MIINPADAMMQQSVKSVHSSDPRSYSRNKETFLPKEDYVGARVARKTRRWQAAPYTSTDLHSCLKSVFSALKGSYLKGGKGGEIEREIERKDFDDGV